MSLDQMAERGRADQHVSRVMNAAHSQEERTQRAYIASQLYSKVGEYDKALSYIDMYLTAHHSDASAFYLRGYILEKRGRMEDAVSAYCSSLSLKPKQKEVIIKICEVVCSIERPPEDQLSKWLEQARKVAAPHRLIESLREKLAIAKGDLQELESIYNEQISRNPDDLLTHRKMINLRLCLSDLNGAKKQVDQISFQLPQAAENLDWIQVCYAVYHRAYTSCLSAEGANPQFEIYPLLSGMLGYLSNTFILKLTFDHKQPKDTLRRFDSHLSALYSSLEKSPGYLAQRLPYQLRFKEHFAHFYQLCAYLLLKLAYDQVLDVSEMLQLAAVCLSISFSITPPSTRDESTEGILHGACSRMCEVGYLMAALARLNGQEWLQRTVKPRISLEGISRIIEVLELQDTRQTPSCLRLHTIDISQVQCTSPSRNHLVRYHEAYIRDHLYQLPFLTWLSLAEVSAYGGHPSFPHSFSLSEHRFKSFPDGSEDLSRTDFSSCSRMDIESFLYMSLYETQQLESTAESSATVLLPIVLHKLSIPEARCIFWTSLISLERAPQNNLSIKDACKHKTTVEKGLFSIRCLKKMELPTLIVFNIAEAFEQRLTDCSPDSLGYSEEKHSLLLARNELYWSETLRRLEMNEAGVSSLLPDDSISNCLAVKLLSLQGKKAVEGLNEEKRKTMRSRAEMVLADLALHRNHVLKAVSIYEKLDLPQAAWNHSQLLKLIALSGNPSIISGTHPRPPTSYDLLMRSQKILSEWTSREEVKQNLQMKQNFENEIQSLNKSIHDHRQEDYNPEAFSDNFPDDNFRDVYESNQLNSATFGQASAPPFSFPPPSAGPHSTPKRNIPNGSETLSIEEQHLNMQMQFERMTLALKQRDDMISDLSKKNVELRGIVQNLQYYFTDQKVLFKNPKDPENAILRPEDLDNIPTPQIPSTVHNLSGRNLSLSNNSPQYPFNNSGSSHKSHTPLNSTHRSLLDSSYQAELNSDFILSPHTASQGVMFDHELEEMQQNRPMLSLKTKPQSQTGDQPSGSSPFANLSLTAVGSGQAQPTRVPFQLNLSAPRESEEKPFGSTTASSAEEFICTAEHKPLINLPLIRTETGEESEDVLFCKKGKLFRYRDNKWVERGVGDIKVLQQRNEHKFRLLMRREIVMKLCCNHLILPTLELKPQSDNSVLWSTHADFSEQGEPESFTLAIRFKTPEIKDEFVGAVNKCIHILKHSTRLKPAPDIQHISPEKEYSPMDKLLPQSVAPPYVMSFGPQLPNPQTLHRPITQSYSDSDDDTDVLSNTSDNEATHDTKGPLRITSSSGEQIIFEEPTSLIVNDSRAINDHGGVKIIILGDSDRAQYKIIMRKDGADRFSHDIRDIGDFRPYATVKSDRSWSWTLNKPDNQPKKLKFIVRFLTTVASGKFNTIMEDCILKTKTNTVSNTKAFPENIASTPEKNPKPIFGMGALQGFTFSSQDHGQLFSTPGTSFMNPLGTPTTPTTTRTNQPEESNTSENSYETDPYYEPVVVLPELKTLKTGEELEEVLFFRRTRLYRFCNEEWKERGIGELKILQNPESGKYRIIMRRDVIKKLCCNHYITPEMTIMKNQSNEKSMNWYTLADFSDETQQPEKFAARFKTVEIATEFEEIFNRCLQGMKTSQSPQKSDNIREPPTKESDTPLTADVVIVSVSQPTEDQIRRARELMLPDCFYLYEDKPDCPGCRGCDDNFPLEHSSEESDPKIAQTTKELKMQPRADIPVKSSGSIFGGNLGNFSFSSFVPSQTQVGSTNPFAKIGKPTNEDIGSTHSKLNEPEPIVPEPKLEAIPAGTEGEEKLLVSRSSELHRLINSEWKEQGKGDLKIFHNLQTGKYRLEMRRDTDASVCCNHFITTEMKLVLESDERTWSWDTLRDLSEETPQSVQFSSRFETPDIAEEFKNVFEGCQEELMNRTLVPFSASAPNAAEIEPVSKNDTIPENNSQTAMPSSQDEEPLSKPDNTDDADVMFVCAYEPTPEQIAVSEKYQLSRYFFSYEEKKPCPGCRGCDEDFEIIYEKDSHIPVRSEATIVKPSLFGRQVENVVSFTTLAQSDSKQGFTGQGNPFKSYARPLFALSSEEGGDPQECEPDSHFKPIVQLAEIQDLRTGEEGEKELFNTYTVLFRFDDGQWKEKGRGDIKILYNEETQKYRVIMRRMQVKKLCCNHYISSAMDLKPLGKTENCWLWHTSSDSSDEEPRPETLAAKFKKIEFYNKFKEVFEQCVSALKALENS